MPLMTVPLNNADELADWASMNWPHVPLSTVVREMIARCQEAIEKPEDLFRSWRPDADMSAKSPSEPV